MKLFDIVGFAVSLVLASVSFIATSNVFIGGGVFVVSLAFYFLLVRKLLISHLSKTNKIHQCYLFINNFLVSLSIKESLNAAFETTNSAISDEYRDYVMSIDDLNPQEKLLYLRKYFPFHIFQLFVDIVLLWVEQGGNILDMSNHVTNEIREIEEYASYCESINKRKALEFFVLWMFSLVIVIVLRISLTEFYSGLMQQPIYIGSIVFLMLVVLLSIYLLILKVVKIEVRGIGDDK